MKRQLFCCFLLLLLVGCGTAHPYEPVDVTPQSTPALPKVELGGSDMVMTMRLAGKVYAVDVAVHPMWGWPAIVAWQRFGLSTDPIAAFARVYNPHVKRWGPAIQIDPGATGNGPGRFASAFVTITGDDTVHVFWGNSDGPESGIWTRTSSDYGVSWSEPKLLAEQCWNVGGVASTPDGQIVVLAMCYGSRANPIPNATFVVRRSDGTWLTPDATGVPGWFGAIAIAGDGADAHAVAMVTSHGADYDNHVAYLISKYLRNTGGWEIRTRRIATPTINEDASGDYHWNIRALAYPRPEPDGTRRTAITFMWTGRRRASAYALTSLDGGLSWGQIEPIVHYNDSDVGRTKTIDYVVPAYDPTADRLAAIWACCGDPGDLEPVTQFASWSVPGMGTWHASIRAKASDPTDLAPATPTPLDLGGRSIGDMDADLASNARKTWLFWVDEQQNLTIRSFELNVVIPVSEYAVEAP